MNYDQLEDFIQKNREAFDSDRPSLKVWAGIEKDLPAIHGRRPWLRYAAAVALLAVGITLGFFLAPKYYEYQALAELEEPGEFKEMVAYFEEEVEHQFIQLAHTPMSDLAQEALSEIESQIEDLKVELVRAPKGTKAKILEAIIASYETKVHLLENMVRRNNLINYTHYDREEQL